jgi:exopolyphosphatase / guanosine-5'-triphosphate,3'-diphosphate pyrophosphatase
VNLEHAQRVRDTAEKLFTDLRRLHRLPYDYKEWLAAAAMLCEVGDYVNRTGRHRHAYYIISHSEILGYTLGQRKLIAAIARYLGKSRPAPGDGPIKTLPLSDQKLIEKASLLLRLAWAMNLGRSGALKNFRVRTRGTAIELVLIPKHPMSVDLELWAVEKERAYFREVFGCDFAALAAAA